MLTIFLFQNFVPFILDPIHTNCEKGNCIHELSDHGVTEGYKVLMCLLCWGRGLRLGLGFVPEPDLLSQRY
jgi:hypothetical protein